LSDNLAPNITCFFFAHKLTSLKFDVVGELTLLQGETRTKVLSEERLLSDNWEEHCVNLLLVGDSDLGKSRFLVPLAGEWIDSVLSNLGLASFEGIVRLLEESVVQLLGDAVFLWNLYLGGGGDDISLVHTTKRNSVDFVWSGDEEKSRSELLQEDDSLSTETTSEQNQNGSRGDLRLQLGEVLLSLGRRKETTNWLLRVVSWGLLLDGSLLILSESLDLWRNLGRLLHGVGLGEVLDILEVVCSLMLVVGRFRSKRQTAN